MLEKEKCAREKDDNNDDVKQEGSNHVASINDSRKDEKEEEICYASMVRKLSEISLVAKHEFSKLGSRVRFPHLAAKRRGRHCACAQCRRESKAGAMFRQQVKP